MAELQPAEILLGTVTDSPNGSKFVQVDADASGSQELNLGFTAENGGTLAFISVTSKGVVDNSVRLSLARAAPGEVADYTQTYEKVRKQAQSKAMINNLRILASSAQMYMLDKGVTKAAYTDLVGTGTDYYVRSIAPVMGEDYTGIVVHQTDTQVKLVAPDGTPVVFNL